MNVIHTANRMMKVSLSSCWICILSSPLHYQKTNAYYLSHSQSHTQSLLHSHLHSYKSQSKSKSKSKSKLKSKDFSLYASQDTIDDWNELPSDFPRRNTVLIALQAVRKASDITIRYQPMENCNIDSTSTSSSSNSNAISKDMSMSMSTSTSTSTSRDIIPTIEKIDASPVTLADYAVQAVVLKHLKDNFDDNHGFIAEESSEELQENPKLTQSILDATYPYIQESLDLMRSIDLGKQLYWNDPTSTTATTATTTTKSKEYPYIWVLDPIDGTKGFLRGKKEGGQYCIALALLEDGIPTIGILGCPNLNDGNGSIFVASRGGGCYELSLKPKVEGYNKKALSVTYNQDESIRKIQNARFCIGVEKSFGDPLGKCIAMAKIIHGDDCCLDEDGDIIQSQRMDSQVKFGVIGRGDAEYYVRLPKEGYREWIWDQAAGNVVLEECGGKMTDQDGNAIDFSLGSQLSEDVKGVLGSNGGIFHDALVHAYQKQEEERRQSN